MLLPPTPRELEASQVSVLFPFLFVEAGGSLAHYSVRHLKETAKSFLMLWRVFKDGRRGDGKVPPKDVSGLCDWCSNS